MEKADLHIHSYASDGEMSAPDILKIASLAGLKYVSVTDHDGAGAYLKEGKALFSLSSELGISLIPGIEFDSEINGVELHILGYNIDFSNQKLADYLEENHQQRNKRIKNLIKYINEKFGVATIKEEDIFLPHSDTLMKPHLIKILLKKRLFKDYSQAKKWMSEKTDADSILIKPHPVKIFELIQDSGGTAVLAHPGYYIGMLNGTVNKLIGELTEYGLKGLEVYYDYSELSPGIFTSSERDRINSGFENLANELGLILTRGSDAHSIRELKKRNGFTVK